MESPFLNERVIAVSAMKAEIRDIENEIEETRKSQPPKQAEALSDGEAKP